MVAAECAPPGASVCCARWRAGLRVADGLRAPGSVPLHARWAAVLRLLSARPTGGSALCARRIEQAVGHKGTRGFLPRAMLDSAACSLPHGLAITLLRATVVGGLWFGKTQSSPQLNGVTCTRPRGEDRDRSAAIVAPRW